MDVSIVSKPTLENEIPLAEVLMIIRRRTRGAIIGATITSLITIFLVIKSPSPIVLATGLSLVLILSLITFVNSQNQQQLKPSYRTFNKFFYIYLARITIVFSILGAIRNIMHFANPLDGFMKPGGSPKAELLTGAAIDAAVGYSIYKTLPAAKQVELYFKQNETNPLI